MHDKLIIGDIYDVYNHKYNLWLCMRLEAVVRQHPWIWLADCRFRVCRWTSDVPTCCEITVVTDPNHDLQPGQMSLFDGNRVGPSCGFCDTPSQVALPCRRCGRVSKAIRDSPYDKPSEQRLAAWEYLLRRKQGRLRSWAFPLAEYNHGVTLTQDIINAINANVEAWLKTYGVPSFGVWPVHQPLTWAMLRNEDWALGSKPNSRWATESWWAACKAQQSRSAKLGR